MQNYLRDAEAGTEVAVEATGNWYWIVTEIEEAGLVPKLVHPRKAKLMMGMINKTDKLDVHGLNVLQRNGTLPTVWIPPAELRDLREITRTRQVLVQERTRLKNRIQATLCKYGLLMTGFSDPYGRKARVMLAELVKQLPPQTNYVTTALLQQLDLLQPQIDQLEHRLEELLKVTPQMQWLMTIPGIGLILATVIALEVGDVSRFPSALHLASYSGTTPRVHSSGDKTRFGRLRPDVNHYLKWAFVEAANCICLNHARRPDRHASRLYKRIRDRKGHPKAIGAVARHLAEATFHVLSRKESYRDPALRREVSKEA
jgi:transposase